MLQESMFLRSNRRMKDGKEHRYYTVVESRRLRSGKVAQRQVLYLGEINDSQQAGWRKTLEVFDEEQHRFTPLSLFPEDRPVPADAIHSVQVKLREMKLERARPYGNCWMGCELWRQLQLDQFWAEKLPKGRESVAWAQVLELRVVIALVMTPTGLPLAYEVMDGNTSDKTTLRSFLDQIESLYGKARRIWLMDRGIPTEAILAEMRTARPETFYLVGTSRAKVKQY